MKKKLKEGAPEAGRAGQGVEAAGPPAEAGRRAVIKLFDEALRAAIPDDRGEVGAAPEEAPPPERRGRRRPKR